MDTLIVGVLLGLMISLITTWITTRIHKSIDSRMQLLKNLETWVSEFNEKCNAAYFKYKNINKNFYDEINEDMSGHHIIGYAGVAKAFKNDELIQALNRHDASTVKFRDSMFKLAIMYEVEEKPFFGGQLGIIERNLHELKVAAEDIHRIIAEERMRIFPKWPERVWLWLRRNILK